MRARGAILAAVVLAGCTGQATCDTFTPAKLSDVQASIFTPGCATSGCHTGSLPAEKLTLDPGKAFGAVVGKHAVSEPAALLVAPGQPGSSLLYQQVQDGVMPQGAPPLSQAQLDQLRGWI